MVDDHVAPVRLLRKADGIRLMGRTFGRQALTYGMVVLLSTACAAESGAPVDAAEHAVDTTISVHTREHAPQQGRASISTAEYEAYGSIRSITPNRKHAVVAHGEIPGFMDAMTMPFAVSNSELLAGYASADSIYFRIAVSGPKIVIIEIRRVE